MDLKISKSRPLRGTLTVPGDKSISHRAVMFNAIADGISEIRGFLRAADCLSTVAAMRSLGVRVDEREDGVLVVHGRGLKGLAEPADVIDVGNSGTTIRMLPGILAGQDFYSVLTGDASIRRRPMGRVVEPLSKMGARMWGREGDRFAPLSIRGTAIKGVTYATPVPSAQVKSAILLAGLYAEGETVVTENAASRDHTERLLGALGADIEIDGLTVRIKGGRALKACDVTIPADISSAAFLLAAALLVEGSEVGVTGVGINPTRTGILEVFEAMKADVTLSNTSVSGGEEMGDLTARSSKLTAAHIGRALIPALIDEIPILAILATQARGKTVIQDAGELRVKESDRLSALADGLRRMGAQVEEMPDGLIIEGPVNLRGARIDSHGDHRIAMSFAVAGLVADGETVIENADCIFISYPGFASALASIGGTIDEL